MPVYLSYDSDEASHEEPQLQSPSEDQAVNGQTASTPLGEEEDATTTTTTTTTVTTTTTTTTSTDPLVNCQYFRYGICRPT